MHKPPCARLLTATEGVVSAVLRIDDLQKELSGTNDGGDDSGVSTWVFDNLITGMGEKENPEFVEAAANYISCLPRNSCAREPSTYRSASAIPTTSTSPPSRVPPTNSATQNWTNHRGGALRGLRYCGKAPDHRATDPRCPPDRPAGPTRVPRDRTPPRLDCRKLHARGIAQQRARNGGPRPTAREGRFVDI